MLKGSALCQPPQYLCLSYAYVQVGYSSYCTHRACMQGRGIARKRDRFVRQSMQLSGNSCRFDMSGLYSGIIRTMIENSRRRRRRAAVRPRHKTPMARKGVRSSPLATLLQVSIHWWREGVNFSPKPLSFPPLLIRCLHQKGFTNNSKPIAFNNSPDSLHNVYFCSKLIYLSYVEAQATPHKKNFTFLGYLLISTTIVVKPLFNHRCWSSLTASPMS